MHPSWKNYLYQQFAQEYFAPLSQFLHQEYQTKVIYPPKKQVFAAFNYPFEDTKVVIIGQDPYHGPCQANGLAFSVTEQVRIPPSLQNIFKEIHDELGTPIPSTGNLERWAKQGVLLLNNTLTVIDGHAGSHRGHGWEDFTRNIIQLLSDQQEHLVFLLWGRDAREKASLVNQKNHLVLQAAHPSPLSAYNGFFGCGHFKQTNDQLQKWGKLPIDW